MIFDALVAGSMRQNALRTAVTVIAIALGVAAVLAGDLGRSSADAALRASVSGLSDRANLQVLGFGTRLDERLLARVRRVAGVVQARPVLQGAAELGDPSAGAKRRDIVTIQGVDALQSFPGSAMLRTYEAGPFAPPSALDMALLAHGGSVISARIARQLGLRSGSRFAVRAAGVVTTLQVAAVLPHQPPTLDPQILIVDVRTAQALFHAAGRLDRIDVIAAPYEAGKLRTRLAATLGPSVHVAVTADRIAALERAARGFEADLTVLSVVVLLVGASLVANAVGLSVRQRRPDIGTLRALGATRGQIARAFVTEGVLLGAGGALIGVIGGDMLARATGSIGGAADLLVVLRDAGLGVAVATGAALAPALQAAATLPVQAQRTVPLRSPNRRGFVAHLLSILPQRMPLFLQLAAANLDGAAMRLALALSALAIAVAASTSVATATSSFETAVTSWLQRSLIGDLDLRPLTTADGRFSARVRARIARLPGVAAVLTTRRITVPFRGALISLDAVDPHTLAARGLSLAQGEAGVSDDAAGRLGVRPGQMIRLDTPAGPTALRVRSLGEDLEGGSGGTLTVAEPTYAHLFGDTSVDTIGIIAQRGTALHRLRVELAAAAAPLEVDIASVRDRRAQEAASFQRTFALTYALGLASIAIAVLGTTFTMLALVLERRREIAVLRIVGLSTRALHAMIVCEAAVLSAFAALCGTLAGVALGGILVALDSRRFGWNVPLHVPGKTVALTVLTVVFSAALAALVPARRAARLAPARALHVVAFIALACCATVVASARGIAHPMHGVSNSPARLAFPHDHGLHRDRGAEWWLVSGHLRTQNGRRFAYHASFYRFTLPGRQELFAAEISVLDERSNRTIALQHSMRATPNPRADGTLAVRVDDFDLSATPLRDPRFARVALRAGDASNAVALTLLPQKPPSPSPAFAGYAFTRMQTQGSVLSDGRRYAVDGVSWLDHEYERSARGTKRIGWERFELQLDDGRDVALFAARLCDGRFGIRRPRAGEMEASSEESPFGPGVPVGGMIVDRDGTVHRLDVGAASLAIQGGTRWQSPRDAGSYPALWRLSIPLLHLDNAVAIAPVARDAEVVPKFGGVPFWWGAVDLAQALPPGYPLGTGFVLLTGYAAPTPL